MDGAAEPGRGAVGPQAGVAAPPLLPLPQLPAHGHVPLALPVPLAPARELPADGLRGPGHDLAGAVAEARDREGPAAGEYSFDLPGGLGGPPRPLHGVGIPLEPVAGGFAGLRLPVAAGPPPGLGPLPERAARMPPFEDFPWIQTVSARARLDTQSWVPNMLIEVPTYSAGAAEPDGTAVFEISEQVGVGDGQGVFLLAATHGASSPLRGIELEPLFPPAAWGRRGGCLHLCRHGMAQCPAVTPFGRAVLHVDTLRFRNARGLTEPWIRGRGDAGAPAGLPGHSVRVGAPGGPAGSAAPEPDGEVARLEARVRQLQEQLFAGRSSGSQEARGSGRDARSRLLDQAAQEESRRAKKKQKRRRRRSSSSSGSQSDGSLFRMAPSRGENRIRALAISQPGKSYDAGLNEITRVMGLREGAGGGEGQPSTVMGYLTAILLG